MMIHKTKLSILPLIFIFFFNSGKICFAQNIQFGKITVEDGLSNSYVNCLLQDSYGFMWFGTDDGLNRFDGYEIKIFRNIPDDSTSLSGNIIWSLFEDSKRYLWIGTKSGKLNRYDPINDKFDHWFLDSTDLEGRNITYIYEDSHSFIWVGTYRNGLYRFNPSQNKFDHWINPIDGPKILNENFITSIIEDAYNNIWVSTYWGLNKFNPESMDKPFIQTDYETFKEPLWYLGNSSFYNNSIWIGKLNGLLKFDPLTTEYSSITLPVSSGLQFGNSVSSVVEGKFADEIILWVGTYGGLIRKNLTSGESERYILNKNNPLGILSNQVNDLVIDRSGVVWIATDNGLNTYSPKRSKFNFPVSGKNIYLDLPELKNENIRSITDTKDETLWVGGESGLIGIQIIKENNKIIQRPEFKSLNVWCLTGGNSHNLWIGTYGQGLKELDFTTTKLKSWDVANTSFVSPAYNYVKTILQDDKGMLWIGFWGGGLARLNPISKKIEHWRSETENLESLSYNDVWALCQDNKGRIWIGTNGGGLNLFNEDKQKSFFHWRADKKNKYGFNSNNIYTICEAVNANNSNDQTILWVGTANGLNKLIINDELKNLQMLRPDVKITNYTVDDGLSDNSVESILEDEYGNLWIGTSSGISFFNINDETFTNYGIADGMNGGSFNASAAFRTPDGISLFGSTKGVNYFDPKKVSQSNYLPAVVITDFQIFNQPAGSITASDINQNIIHKKEIVLSHNQNDLSFEFASLDFNASEMNQYAYMMEGFDEDWIFSGKRRFVTYTNLDPGEYVFQVKATNSDGLWSNQFAKIFIVITPPFWQTWWAYSIYVIVFIGSLIFLREVEIKRRQKKEAERLKWEREEARIREAELKAKNIEQENEIEKQKMRNRIAQDLHDEIGSNLSSISLMSELIQKDEKLNQKISEKLNRIYKVAKGSTQAMRDIVWLTNPSSDSLRDLIVKMREVADNTLGKFNLNFNYPKDVAEVNLLPETKRNIFFIYKETLNNIVKHAEAKSVEIEFDIKDLKIFLSIKDDGIGFNTSASFKGNGLKNIKARAKEINADLNFESRPGHGALLKLSTNIT
jgi:signal transduction histidine kinase/ligand-binding sensor domain-containing protein